MHNGQRGCYRCKSVKEVAQCGGRGHNQVKEVSSQHGYACEGGAIAGLRAAISLREMLGYFNHFKYLWEVEDTIWKG